MQPASKGRLAATITLLIKMEFFIFTVLDGRKAELFQLFLK